MSEKKESYSLHSEEVDTESKKNNLLLGKTITVDPISKRRLDNMGEEEQYYIKDHHEPIISAEAWDQACAIRETRSRGKNQFVNGVRIKGARKYALSSMCECGFCGNNLSRRWHNKDSHSKKPVWKCITSIKQGIANCPQSKSIDESIIESAFMEMFHLLAENFDDVLEAVLDSVENTILNDESMSKLKRIEKNIGALESKRKKLTDMLLDDKITKEAYDERYEEFTAKINRAKKEKETNVLEEFDRVVFESIVEKVIVGETKEDGSVDPYKLTFVLKGIDNRVIPDAKNRYINH